MCGIVLICRNRNEMLTLNDTNNPNSERDVFFENAIPDVLVGPKYCPDSTEANPSPQLQNKGIFFSSKREIGYVRMARKFRSNIARTVRLRRTVIANAIKSPLTGSFGQFSKYVGEGSLESVDQFNTDATMYHVPYKNH